jgi:hypothetical protein
LNLKKHKSDDDSYLLLAAGFHLGNRIKVAGRVLPPLDIKAAISRGKVLTEKLEFFPEVWKV